VSSPEDFVEQVHSDLARWVKVVAAGKISGDEGRYPELLKKNPFGRPASVDEIAATVMFLASALSSYTSGAIATIDGGFSKRPAV